jgi:spermidine synthase
VSGAGRHRPVSVPITLSESEGVRCLHFGTPWVQGAMLVGHPQVLVLEYIQRMMAWLLFLHPPAEILQLGLGAGSLTRLAHRRLRRSRVTVIEASRDVIDVCHACFALPPEDERLRLRCDDAARFVARRDVCGRFGVIQVDLYDAEARGPTCDSLAFYEDCRRALADPGVCVVNLFGRHASYRRNLARLASAFEGRILALPAGAAGNIVVLAFKGPQLAVPWTVLRERAEVLGAHFGWPTALWVNAIRAARPGARCVV